MKHSISSQKSGQNVNLENKENKYTVNEKSLEHHFKQVKQENYNETFPEVENWLYRAGIQQNNNQLNERKLRRMKNFFFAHKLRLVYTIVAFAVLVAACNMPVTQTETAGNIITVTVPTDNTDFDARLNTLPWIKDAKISVNPNTDGDNSQALYTIILPNTTEEQVKNYGKDIEALGGITMIRIKPMNYDVKRPLYSAALDNFFSIKIDATGKSDEEVEAELQKQLDEQGVNMKFSFRRTPEGKRDLLIEKTKEGEPNDPRQFELTIDENNGNEKLKVFTKKVDPDKFNGKTDQEIREMVRKDFNGDVKDNEIIIERNGDKVQVRVEKDRKQIK